MADQLELFARPGVPRTATSVPRTETPALDPIGAGVVLHPPDGSHLRIRGRLPDGTWLAAPCDAYGKDIRGADLVTVTRNDAFMARFLAALEKGRTAG